jgi:hypothetical protein
MVEDGFIGDKTFTIKIDINDYSINHLDLLKIEYFGTVTTIEF